MVYRFAIVWKNGCMCSGCSVCKSVLGNLKMQMIGKTLQFEIDL